MSKIYVASSWRNPYQYDVVQALRAEHEVYDFRTASWDPRLKDGGFSWADIDPDWKNWSPERFRSALDHRNRIETRRGRYAMMEAEEFCLVLPCGRSAHLEAGWAMGTGRLCSVYAPEQVEPELMYLLAEGDDRIDRCRIPWAPISRIVCTTIDEVLALHRRREVP